ncbi:hypothetical protein A3709_08730 [Halioglobus sp. HI00S01]|uniref:hypothetical protein n=1 Tax=Halioglobus sp. HI00S01 TaxID=1822214 RepID=UPI0007C34E9E|nr:hypothetical protein [Halioglobus sp. HI00S01]KZX55069.1 hypothetical protein A3709_08730 [Halioglobus sp. HI00S01]
MKRLVIHAGMAKTGTTTIQESLGEMAAELRSANVFYPGWRPYNHSYELAALFRRNPKVGFYYRQFAPPSDEAWEEERERLLEQWRAFFTSFDEGTAIVSAEGLEQFFVDELRAFLDFAEPFFDECVAVIYVRHPLTSIKSRWEQAVKQLDALSSGEALLQDCKRRTRFAAVRRWANAIGEDRLKVRAFDPDQFVDGNPVDDFLHSIDLGYLTLPIATERASNTSLGFNGTSLLLQLNGQYPLYLDGVYNPERGMTQHQELLHRLMREIEDTPLSIDVKFNDEEAAAINHEIALVNQFLPGDAQFAQVQASDGESDVPEPDKVAPRYVAALVNGLLGLLEREKADRQHLAREVKRLSTEMLAREDELAALRELYPEDDEVAASPNDND